MAYPTVSAPYGFKPVNLMGGRVYSGSTRMVPIKEAYATSIFYGDLVGYAAGSLISSALAYNSAAPVAGTLGVFAGCEYSPPTGPLYGKQRQQYWLASTAAQDAVGYVVDDPFAIFKVVVIAQPGGAAANTSATVGAVSEAFVGSNVFPVTGTAGSTQNGDSAWGVSSSTAPTNGFGVVRTATTGPFRIVQLVPDTSYTITQAGTISATTVTLAVANPAIQAGMQIIVPNSTGTGYITNGAPGDFNYVTNVNGVTITIATTATQATSVNLVFVAYPEVLVAWSGTYHSYLQAAGV
jgi:hypothetical protein